LPYITVTMGRVREPLLQWKKW